MPSGEGYTSAMKSSQIIKVLGLSCIKRTEEYPQKSAKINSDLVVMKFPY